MIPKPDVSLYIHVIGFTMGIVLYAMLGVMAWQGRKNVRWPGKVLSEPTGSERPLLLLTVAALGVALSIAANVLHLRAILHTDAGSPAAWKMWAWITVIGYAALMALIAVYMWKLTPVQRSISIAAMAVFAVSALHMIQGGDVGSSIPLWGELVVHYAPLPLVAALLYQEYRFALADVFFKRTVGLIILVVIATGAYLVAKQSGSQAVTISLWIGTALLYPLLQQSVNQFVDRRILRRSTAREVRIRLASAIDNEDSIEVILDTACIILRDALTARWVTWSAHRKDDDVKSRREAYRYPPYILMDVSVSENPTYSIAVGELAGGRRLLSGDMDVLEIVSLDVARRIDAVRMTEERFERTSREAEALALATEAELKALQAQLNPHFLFNALTTVGHLIQIAPDRALSTLLRLTDLLRAVLRKTSGDFVPLQDEILLIEAYLAIERERFEERLTTHIDVSQSVMAWPIPPLLIQPLVENAIKHGIAPLSAGGDVTIKASVSKRSDGEEVLLVSVTDTGAGVAMRKMMRGKRQGVGLSNIERRMEQLYGKAASMSVSSEPGEGMKVELEIPRPQI